MSRFARALGIGLLLLGLAAGAEHDEAVAPVPQLVPPVHPALAEAFIAELFERWNSRRLDAVLASEFPQRDRVLETFPQRLPPDARLRLINVGAVHTLKQEIVDGAVVSVVSAVVHAQLEYEDPEHGFQRHASVGEYIFRIVRRAPR